MRTLLLGCGNTRDKRSGIPGDPRTFPEEARTIEDREGLFTVDINPNCGALLLWDLNNIGEYQLPWPHDHFDEIHMYEVLEHIGTQGDWRAFFDQFTEFYRLLKPNGLFVGSVPVLGSVNERIDPGHTRRFCTEWFVHLNQEEYTKQIGPKSMMTDYRWYYKADFIFPMIGGKTFGIGRHEGIDYFIIQAIKPSRISI